MARKDLRLLFLGLGGLTLLAWKRLLFGARS